MTLTFVTEMDEAKDKITRQEDDNNINWKGIYVSLTVPRLRKKAKQIIKICGTKYAGVQGLQRVSGRWYKVKCEMK